MNKRERAQFAKELQLYVPGTFTYQHMLVVPNELRVLKAILFDGSQIKDAFHVRVLVFPLYVRSQHLTLNFGYEIPGLWTSTQPNIMSDLGAKLESEAVPFLQKITGYDEFLKMLEPRFSEARNIAACATLAKKGDYHEALEAIDHFVSTLKISVFWQQNIVDEALVLRSRILQSPESTTQLLGEWEEYTLNHLKMDFLRR